MGEWEGEFDRVPEAHKVVEGVGDVEGVRDKLGEGVPQGVAVNEGDGLDVRVGEVQAVAVWDRVPLLDWEVVIESVGEGV